MVKIVAQFDQRRNRRIIDRFRADFLAGGVPTPEHIEQFRRRKLVARIPVGFHGFPRYRAPFAERRRGEVQLLAQFREIRHQLAADDILPHLR